MSKNKGFIVGNLTLREVYLINQEEAYLQNEYLIAENNGVNVPLEVYETTAVPMLLDDTIPNSHPEYLKKMGFSFDKPAFIAKAKILSALNKPMMPNSIIRKPSFAEIQDKLIHADVADSMKLGTIQGTESMQAELPKEYQKLSPVWENKKAQPQNGVPFMLDHHKFREYPHIGIFGTSGSGKTFGLRTIVEELMTLNVPGLILDPHHEMDFTKPMEGLDDDQKKDFSLNTQIFYVGKDMGIPFTELKFDELVYLFDFVGSLSEPMKSSLEAVYEKGDTLMYLKQKVTMLKSAFEMYERPKNQQDDSALDDDTKLLYKKLQNKVSGSVTLQAVAWRLDALESTGVFEYNKGIQGIEKAITKGKMAVLRGDMNRLQMVAFYTIRKLYKKRKNYQDYKSEGSFGIEKEKSPSYFPAFFVVVDEAHNFAPKDRTNPTKQILKTIAQEARKYGVFEIFCTQKPDGIDQTIFAQLNTKIIYRINTLVDMEMIKQETNLNSEQMAQLPELQSGHCFVSSAILPKTFAVRFRTTFTQSPHTVDPFEESKAVAGEQKSALEDTLEILCENRLRTSEMAKIITILEEELGEVIQVGEVYEALDEMVKKGTIIKKKSVMGSEYIAA